MEPNAEIQTTNINEDVVDRIAKEVEKNLILQSKVIGRCFHYIKEVIK